MTRLLRYIGQILIAVDQLLNTLVPFGWADETFSARCYRERENGPHWAIMRFLVDSLFLAMPFVWQSDHCRKSYEAERSRYQLPQEYRK